MKAQSRRELIVRRVDILSREAGTLIAALNGALNGRLRRIAAKITLSRNA